MSFTIDDLQKRVDMVYDMINIFLTDSFKDYDFKSLTYYDIFGEEYLVKLLTDRTKKEKELIVKLAAKYCKADLKSGCVQEFPDEMQGIMGGILVRKQLDSVVKEKLKEIYTLTEDEILYITMKLNI